MFRGRGLTRRCKGELTFLLYGRIARGPRRGKAGHTWSFLMARFNILKYMGKNVWLGDQDLNLGCPVQSREFYR